MRSYQGWLVQRHRHLATDMRYQAMPLSQRQTRRKSDALLEHNISLYAQDTWRTSSRLVLTFGVRWDIDPPLEGKNLANQPFTVTGLNDPVTLALAPRGTPLYQTTYGNVAPRFGVAYQIHKETVLRAGFGTFYDLGYGSLGGASTYFP